MESHKTHTVWRFRRTFDCFAVWKNTWQFCIAFGKKWGFLNLSRVWDALFGKRGVSLLPVGGKLLWKRRKMSTESGTFQNFSTIPHFCQSTRITAPVAPKPRGLCGKTVQKKDFSNKFSTAVENRVENSKTYVGNLKFPFWFRWAPPRTRGPR